MSKLISWAGMIFLAICAEVSVPQTVRQWDISELRPDVPETIISFILENNLSRSGLSAFPCSGLKPECSLQRSVLPHGT